MTIEFRKDYTYSMVVPTSMGGRLTPVSGQPVHSSKTFILEASSAESNVASVSSYLGLPVKVLTTFVKGSPIARFIKDDLAGRHMDYEAKEVEQGGPWGYRHQFNLADSGLGSRGPRVQNDRAGEVGSGGWRKWGQVRGVRRNAARWANPPGRIVTPPCRSGS